MARGGANQAESILYGDSGPRWIPPADDFQIELAPDVIGYFEGETGRLTKLRIAAEVNDVYVGEEYFDGAATVHVEDNRAFVRDNLNVLADSDDLLLHREDGPAVIYDRGDEEWWDHGKLHRPPPNSQAGSGPAAEKHQPAIIRANGGRAWFVDGDLHREDGPAEIFHDDDGMVIRQWSQYGQLHRDDGPAVEFEGAAQMDEYWLYGEEYMHKADWEQALVDGP